MLRLQALQRPFSSIYRAIKSYSGSKAQQTLHGKVPDVLASEVRKLVSRASAAEVLPVAFSLSQLYPMGRWTHRELRLDETHVIKPTTTEEINENLIMAHGDKIMDALEKIYKAKGRSNLKFIFEEEIAKIGSMNEAEFKAFIKNNQSNTEQ